MTGDDPAVRPSGRIPAIRAYLRVHEMLIVSGSARSIGTGKPADLHNPDHYPVEALCVICKQPVRRDKRQPGRLDWPHTGWAGKSGTTA